MVILGSGSYGEVSIKNGIAVKKFTKLSHLIQEFIALKYLEDCNYIVHTKGVNFSNLELYMDLYDCSLRNWLDENSETPDFESNVLIVLKDILYGLIELHDRDLAHGDLKPSNVLIQRSPFHSVLGDCGFVSVCKYAKVDRTASVYRDPVIDHDPSHDMFSFGICFLEMICNIKIHRQATYSELQQLTKNKVKNPLYRKIIYNLLHENKERRPSARSLLFRLFNETLPHWDKPVILIGGSSKKVQSESLLETSTSNDESQKLVIDAKKHSDSDRIIIPMVPEHREYIRTLIKTTANEFEIARSKKGYGAIISYIVNHKISSKHHKIYTAVTLMVLSSLFGRSGFRETEVIDLCQDKYDIEYLYRVLNNLLSDRLFITILLSPLT